MMSAIKFLLFISLLFFRNSAFSQATVERDSKYTPEVKEVYNVLQSDYSVNQGIYAAYLKKQLVAAGRYDKGKKAGTWNFFSPTGILLQRYSYETRTLSYEAPETDTDPITYRIDKPVNDSDRITKPMRIGGRYYGYLPYTNLVRLPPDFKNLNNETNVVLMELLVSPGGRLAEYKLRIQSPEYPDAVLNLNIDLLKEEDKVFVPATYNGEPVSSQIIIRCRFTGVDRILL